MIPPASLAIRQATHDTVIKVPYSTSTPGSGADKGGKGDKSEMMEKDVLIKKGTVLVGDLLGVREYLEEHFQILLFFRVFNLIALTLYHLI